MTSIHCWNEKSGYIGKKDCDLCSGASPISKDAYTTFTSPQHGSDLLKALCLQRSERRYLDCDIRVSSGTTRANRALLSSFSRYFSALFKHEDNVQMQAMYPRQFAGARRPATLTHLSSNAVKVLIDCAYSGHMIVVSDEIPKVLNAADFLCLPSVTSSSKGDQVLFNRRVYLRNLSKDLCEQRVSGVFLDCFLEIGCLNISAHSFVLSAFSPFFDNYFRCKPCELDAYFHSLQPNTIEALVNFAYTGEIRILTCDILELIRSADFLGFKSVSDLCYEYIESCLNVDNCLSIHQQALLSNNERFIDVVKRYIVHNFTELSMKDELLNQHVRVVAEFLKHDELCMMRLYENPSTMKYFFIPPNEQEALTLQFITQYVQRNSKGNLVELSQLLRILGRGVRLSLIGLSGLLALRETEFYKESADRQAILSEAIRYCQGEEMKKGINLSEGRKRNKKRGNVERRISLSASGSSRWMTPRTLTRLGFSCSQTLKINCKFPPTNQCEKFNDSEKFLLPVQFVTGMDFYVRNYNQKRILCGLRVTYNHTETVLHGVAESAPILSFQFSDPNERVTGVRHTMHHPEKHMINFFECTTNTGTIHSYISYGFPSKMIRKPQDSLYLAYLTGAVDVFDGKITLRDVGFFFATDKQASK